MVEVIRLLRKLALAVMLVAIGWVIVTATPPRSERPRPQATVTASSGQLSTTPVYLWVAGTRFGIPRNYFFYPPEGHDTDEHAFLLHMMLPNFSGADHSNFDEWVHIGGGWRDTIQVLFQDHSQAPNLKIFSTIWTDRFPVTKHDDFVYGLQHFSYRAPYAIWDVYAHPKGDDYDYLMKCNSPISPPHPGCEMVIFYGNGELVIDFDRRQLSSWKTIHDGVLKLMERFAAAGGAPNR